MDDNVDADGVQVRAELTPDGRFELLDPVPMAPPVGMRAEPTIIETIRMMVRREVSAAAFNEGYETFEESDDFDIEDDPLDPLTPYEKVFDPKPPAVPEATLKTPLPDAPKPVEAPKAADVSQSGYPFQEANEAAVASPPPGSPGKNYDAPMDGHSGSS